MTCFPQIGYIGKLILIINSYPDLVGNAPPSDAPLESIQRGRILDMIDPGAWILDPRFRTGPSSLAVVYFFGSIQLLALNSFVLLNSLIMMR